MRVLLVVLMMVGPVAACTPGNNSTDDNVIETTGTVRYVDLEGGFYGLVADDGSRYDPSGLPEEFQEDGLVVEFRVEPQEGQVTTRMWGQLVRLLEIERM